MGSLNVAFHKNEEGSTSARLETPFLINQIVYHLMLGFIFCFIRCMLMLFTCNK